MSNDSSDSFEQRIQRREELQRHALTTVPAVDVHMNGNIPNTPLMASLISFFLGAVFCFGALMFSTGGFSSHWWATYQLGFFMAAWSAFHWGEFAVTAGWNLEKCSVESFLLDNGSLYHIANGSAVLEYLLTLYFVPSFKTHPYVSLIGVLLVTAGQYMRSSAMIHASTNFSHALAFRKRESHRLVTDGVYAWFRHPSYSGFFYWALGTQLVLQNPFCFVLYIILLWRFFYYRIKSEEKALIKFFGDDYVKYRNSVGTRIPFIP